MNVAPMPRNEAPPGGMIRAALARGMILCSMLPVPGFFVSGCMPPAKIHPDYAKLAPKVIAVLPVVNKTIHQLDQVPIGGLAQRWIVGMETFDVPDILRGALEEALVLREYMPISYTVDPEKGPPDFSRPIVGANPPFDGALVATIESWTSGSTSLTDVTMRYRVELYRVPTAEKLFSGEFDMVYRENVMGSSANDLRSQIRYSAQRALRWLPQGSD